MRETLLSIHYCSAVLYSEQNTLPHHTGVYSTSPPPPHTTTTTMAASHQQDGDVAHLQQQVHKVTDESLESTRRMLSLCEEVGPIL